MKKIIFLSICLVSGTVLKADVRQDLSILAMSLNTLAETLKVQPVIKPIIPPQQPPQKPPLQNVPIITAPNPPGQVSSKQLAVLLPDAQRTFMELATDMNQFIRILGSFVQFTKGRVNPIAESAQLNDLAVLLSQRFMGDKIYTLKNWIDKINQLRSQVSPEDAKIVFAFLADILDQIDNFMRYLNEVYDKYKAEWERVTFVYKYPFEGYAQKAPASYHFYNTIIQVGAITRLENVVKDLKQMLPYWEKRAETKKQGGAQIAQGKFTPIIPPPAEIQVVPSIANFEDINLASIGLPLDQAAGDFEGYMHAVIEKVEEFLKKVVSSDKDLRIFNELVALIKKFQDVSKRLNDELIDFNKQSNQFTQEDAKIVVKFLKGIQTNMNNFNQWITAADQRNFSNLQNIRFIYKSLVMTPNAPAGDKFIEFVVTPISQIMQRGTEPNLANVLNDSILDWEEKVNPSTSPIGGKGPGYEKVESWINT